MGRLARVAVPTYVMSPWHGPAFLSLSSLGKEEMLHLFLSPALPRLPGPGSLSPQVSGSSGAPPALLFQVRKWCVGSAIPPTESELYF